MGFCLVLSLLMSSSDDLSLFPSRQTAFDEFVDDLMKHPELDSSTLKMLSSDDPILLSKGCWVIAAFSSDCPLDRKTSELLSGASKAGWAVAYLPVDKFPLVAKHYSIITPEVIGLFKGEPLDRQAGSVSKERIAQITQRLTIAWRTKQEPVKKIEPEITTEPDLVEPDAESQMPQNTYFQVPRASGCPKGGCPGGCPR